MATQFDLKTATPDTSFPSGAFLFGADSQSASDPSIYSSNAYLSYILGQTNSWTGAQTFTATQTITPAANTNALAVTGYSLTGSNAQSLLDLAGTWNTSGTPTAIKLNITNTASNSSSLLLDFQLNSSSVFRVTRSGHMLPTTFQQIDGFWGGASQWLWVATSGFISLGGNSSTLGPILRYDADHTLAQRVGTNPQFYNIYATYTSATDYHRVKIGTAKTTLASVSGATVTATAIIPDGAIVVGVTTKVTVSLGTGGGTTGYQVGDGSDADRWGQIVGTAAGTSTDNTNWTATTVQAFTSAQDVVITADGGNFNGTGSIEVAVQYLIGQCD